MPLYLYAWANGHNVVLASLANVEDYLWPYTRPRRIAPRSQPLDLFPVETQLMSGRVRGDGFLDHDWEMTLPTDAYAFILNDKFSGGSVKSVEQTVYTRRHDLNTYARANCYLVQPSQKNGTLEYLRQNVVRATFRLANVELL